MNGGASVPASRKEEDEIPRPARGDARPTIPSSSFNRPHAAPFWIFDSPYVVSYKEGGSFFGAEEFCDHAEVFKCGRVAFYLTAGGDLLEQTAHDFSRARFGQGFGETDVIR